MSNNPPVRQIYAASTFPLSPGLRAKIAAALLCLIVILGAIPLAQGAKKLRYAYRSTYTFENRGEEPYVLVEDDTEIPLYVNNKWQSVTILESSHDILEELPDEDGNPVGHLDLPPEIFAGGTLIFTVEYMLESEGMDRPVIDPERSGNLDDIPERLVEIYTSETETFKKNEEIETLALELAAGNIDVLEIVTDILDWVVSRVNYRNFEVPLYPDETLGDLQGDCDDQAILMISMLRSLGIPAFLQIGVVFSESISSEKASWEGHLTFVQEGIGWHGWAMVYVPPWGWLPIDLTLTNARDPMAMILDAPEYASNIITAFNVSAQQYIGGSRSSREMLVASDIYITVADIAIDVPNSSFWNGYTLIGAGVFGGGIMVSIYIFFSRKKS
jgi:transglutaminase-like putative cysteine protease